MKLASITDLITLVLQMAWAFAAAAFGFPEPLSWLAGEIATVQFVLDSRIGSLLARFVEAEVIGLVLGNLGDAVNQLAQFGMGTRKTWDGTLSAQASLFAAAGGAAALPLGVLGHRLAGQLASPIQKVRGQAAGGPGGGAPLAQAVPRAG